MQLDALAYLRRLAIEHPAGGVRRVRLIDVSTPKAAAVCCWYAGLLPELEALEVGEGGDGSMVVNPSVFLPWVRKKLEDAGVRFQRISTVESLEELKTFGHGILIDASGLVSRTMLDVRDEELTMDSTYVSVVRSTYGVSVVRSTYGGAFYTFIFGRGDGSAVVSGISHRRGSRRCEEDCPSVSFGEYQILQHLVGIRPLRPVGVRVEKELPNGRKSTIGGYIHSFGLARKVVRLVDEFAFKF
ncbi:uncharacterized protein B0T15DRAFT_439495 [Chaetomium strumarium]|uniref:FAD dependent oxidoreductase domain-containing protein n=1 Tax=Chaetomium strumarium TaxID=1170767 RepID=A0AAJ0GPF9_9PEZI|nr:hypothetical protein B0T15DRAFT_439495 [Chaetomium strumarium]